MPASTKKSRARQIESIIKDRLPLARRLNIALTSLKETLQHISGLKELQGSIFEQSNSRIGPFISNEVVDDLIQEGKDLSDFISSLRHRFSRKTLNIGVVGRARQGKSKLLQSLTGLSGNVIPDGDLGDCTGVSSTIFHDPEATTASARLEFHTEKTLLQEVIWPYFDALELPNRPISLQDFAAHEISDKFPHPSPTTAQEAKYKRLHEYHQNIQQYSHLIGRSPEEKSEDEIKGFISRSYQEGMPTQYKYVAVRGAEIRCRFPNSDVGKIALVDTPGLGHSGVGDEERLIQTLGRAVDLMLFIRTPGKGGGDWRDFDFNLYDIVSKAVGGHLPIQDWAFMVLNHFQEEKGDLSKYEHMKNSLARNPLRFARPAIICDCSNPEQVDRRVLEEALNYLAAKITIIDSQYSEHCRQKIKHFQEKLSREIGMANVAIEEYSSESPLFENKFNEYWSDLTHRLENIVRGFEEISDQDDDEFSTAIERVIESAATAAISIDNISYFQRSRDEKGSYLEALCAAMHEIRAEISTRFIELDGNLQSLLTVRKKELVRAFNGKILLGSPDEEPGEKALDGTEKRIPESLPILKLSFRTLANFNVSYAGIIQRRIRNALHSLEPDRQSDRILSPQIELGTLIQGAVAELENQTIEDHTQAILVERLIEIVEERAKDQIRTQEQRAQHIQNILGELQKDTVRRCREALSDLKSAPNRFSYIMAIEFADRVLRSRGVKTEWRIFLNKIKADIWPEFKEIEGRQRMRDQWLDKVRSVSQAASGENYNF